MNDAILKFFGYLILFISGVLVPVTLVGFWIFLYTGPFFPVDLNLQESSKLLLDAILSLIFFLQHSIMVRPFFREWLARYLPASFYGPLYATASGSALLLLLIFWQETSTVVVAFEEPVSWFFHAGYFISLVGFVWCIVALGLVDPFGLTPLVEDLRGTPASPVTFVVRGPYRWVRHPIYLFCLLIIWSEPYITTDRLLLNTIWTLWIVVATFLEERNMISTFGKEYKIYQSQVPMLIPYRKNSRS